MKKSASPRVTKVAKVSKPETHDLTITGTDSLVDAAAVNRRIEDLVARGRGDTSYLEATVEVCEATGIDFAFAKSILTPKIIEEIREDGIRTNHLRKPKSTGFSEV